MKFIREIIGEKRQMDRAAREAAAEPPVNGALVDELLAKAEGSDQDETIVLDRQVTMDDAVSDDTGAAAWDDETEDFDSFFDEEDEDAEDEAYADAPAEVNVAELMSDAATEEEEPESLYPPEMSDEDDAPAPAAEMEAEAESYDTRAVDRVLISEEEPDPEVEAVLRAAREQAKVEDAPAPEPVRTEPSEAAEAEAPPQASPFGQHTPDFLKEDTAEASASSPEAQPAPAPAPEAQAAPAEPEPPARVEVPKPAVGRGTSRHGRVKTRLLGFNAAQDSGIDPMSHSRAATGTAYTEFPVGWLIVTEGSGRGSAFTLFNGVSNIGRGEDQTVRLDFGDNTISRENHASIAYDPRQKSFYIGHGGKANLVRRNDRPVLSTEEMAPGDRITIGETTLRFVPFCGPDFSWEESHSTGQSDARRD